MKTLLLVDLQNDFMPGGPLAVPGGDQIIPIINQLIPKFPLVVASQDWHPANHLSFAVNHPGKKVGEVILLDDIEQILWPVHCVRDTNGAEFVANLNKKPIEKVFHKGTDERIDSYSAFFDNSRRKSTGLADFLRSSGVEELYIAGVATDYCVLYTVLDAIELGFKVCVITDACKAINLSPEDEDEAFMSMNEEGAILLTSSVL